MSSISHDADLRFQEELLQGVSRTFALTIPQLPGPLREVVGNGYLLCRIADTIEDEPGIAAEEKRLLSERFSDVVVGDLSAKVFAQELAPTLTAASIPKEHELIANTVTVIRLTHSFRDPQRRALESCVRVMSRGMADYQQNASLRGLASQRELDRYCYHVAGVVGEMLTELFCDYSPSIRARRTRLMELAVSFGQGLQMTNILKDIWDDQERGACWLPRDVFARHGFEVAELRLGSSVEFQKGLFDLIAMAHHHLANALEYTLLIPSNEPGMRRFCLWAIGMAVLTLRKLHANPGFSSAGQVKISRRSVKATIAISAVAARHDRVLKGLFDWLSRPLPHTGEYATSAPAKP